ncbi:MAG TPA: four helix bundle protein [Opitutaceae bacterium]|nr:four helix bundle protein [Opitutaceae bacterium]
MGTEGFRELRVWQAAKELAVEIYRLSASGPLAKDFGLRDQIRRAAVSIPSNIAEGDERDTNRDSVRFLYIAKGSLAELRTQLEIAREVSLLPPEAQCRLEQNCAEIGRMLGALIKARTDHP